MALATAPGGAAIAQLTIKTGLACPTFSWKASLRESAPVLLRDEVYGPHGTRHIGALRKTDTLQKFYDLASPKSRSVR